MPVSALRSSLLVSTIFLGGGLLLAGFFAGAPSTEPSSTASDPAPIVPRSASVDTQHIALEKGANLVSSRIAPDTPSLEAVFAPIASSIDEVRDEQDRVYRPGGVNEIGDWEAHNVYEVHATSPATLVLEGTALATEALIPLQKGWNLVPYVPDASRPVEEALSSIGSSVAVVKDEVGTAYVPSEGVNQLEQLAPGNAYKVNVSESVSLRYADGSAYAAECLKQPNVIVPADYGSFVVDTPNDSLQRVENAATLNAAIADAPSPGTVCLPRGDYYLFPTSYSGQGTDNIEILRDSITIWGAGDNQNGDGTGLHTRGSYHVNENGKVVRGNGLAVEGSDTEVFKEYTLRDFELEGGSGHTGDYGWPADPSDGSGFDLTHKGIKINSGTEMRNVLIENIWLHGYQGEITHAPGFSGDFVAHLTLRNSIVGDTNGGAMNFQGKSLTVKNNIFRNTQGWGELFSWPGWSGEFVGNTFEDQHGSANGYSIHSTTWEVDQPWVFKNNTFRNCDTGGDGGRALAFTGGISDVLVENNMFIDCELAKFQYIPNPDDPTEQGLTPWNQKITIQGNTVKSNTVNGIIQIQGSFNRNINVTGNTFQPETVGQASGRGVVDYCCNPTLKAFIVSENTFQNVASESHDGGSGGGGDVPRFTGENTYVNVGWNVDQPNAGGTYRVEGSRLEPRVGGNSTGEMYMPTEAGHADGHVVTLKKLNSYGTPQFSTDNPSVSVPQDTSLAEVGQELTFEYDATEAKWQLIE